MAYLQQEPRSAHKQQNNNKKKANDEKKLMLFLVTLIATQTFSMELQTEKPKLRWAANEKDDFLFRAVLARDVVAVKQALNDGAYIEARCTNSYDTGKTPVSLACTFSDPLIVGQLLNSGADCNTPDGRGLPPLYHALQVIHTRRCVPLVEALVRHGADIGMQKNTPHNTIQPEGFTPLHRMAELMDNTHFGEKDKHEDFDIRTAEEVFARLELLVTIMVKEVIHQAYREGKSHTWESKLKTLFS